MTIEQMATQTPQYIFDPSMPLRIRLAPNLLGIQLPKRTTKPAVNCPFCRGLDTADLCSDTDSKAKFYWLQCCKCEACGPTAYDPDEAQRLWDQRRETT